MKTYYQRYMSGEHITVYSELMALGENVFSAAYAQDAWSVATEMMRRVQHNITILVPRLQAIGYHFGAGLYDDFSEEERKQAEAALPIYGPPTPSTDASIAFVEQHVGPIPYTLKAFYHVVGSVNLVGLFPHFLPEHKRTHLGYDPLFVYPIEMVIKMRDIGTEEQSAGIVSFPIAPDSTFKYNYSGSGSYALSLPYRCFDAPIDLFDARSLTFVQYLRLCFQRGGFPDWDTFDIVPQSIFAYLVEDLIPF